MSERNGIIYQFITVVYWEGRKTHAFTQPYFKLLLLLLIEVDNFIPLKQNEGVIQREIYK